MSEQPRLEITDLVPDELYELCLPISCDEGTARVRAWFSEIEQGEAVFFLDGDEPYNDAVGSHDGRVDVPAAQVGDQVRMVSFEEDEAQRENELFEIAAGIDPFGWADPHEVIQLHGGTVVAIQDRSYWGDGLAFGTGWVLAVLERIALVDEIAVFGWPVLGRPVETSATPVPQIGALVRPIEGPLASQRCFFRAVRNEFLVLNDDLLEQTRAEHRAVRDFEYRREQERTTQDRTLDRYGLRGVINASSVLVNGVVQSSNTWFSYNPTSTTSVAPEPAIYLSIRELAKFANAVATSPEVAERLIREVAIDAIANQ